MYIKTIKSTVSYLSGRKRITVNEKDFCQSMDDQVVSELIETVKKFNTAVAATSITAIAIHGILFIILLIVDCCNIFIYERSCRDFVRGEESGTWVWIFWVFTFVEIIFFVIMALLVSVFHTRISSHRNYFLRLREENCFTEGQPSLVIDDLEVTMKEIPVRFLRLSIALLIITTVSFVFTIRLRRCENKYE